jgi:hypothetical protein
MPHTPRYLLAALFAVLALALFAPAAGARVAENDGVPRLALPATGVLRTGDRVELRWDGGIGDVRELEIMLTIDGAQRRTIQVSPQLDPARGVYVWRVPELGRASGRFRIRYEHDGHEVEGAPSTRIELLSALAAPIDPALLPGRADDGPASRDPSRSSRTPSSGESTPDARASRRALAGEKKAGPTGSLQVTVAAAHSREQSVPSFVPARN